jgi:hypothetical protein
MACCGGNVREDAVLSINAGYNGEGSGSGGAWHAVMQDDNTQVDCFSACQ